MDEEERAQDEMAKEVEKESSQKADKFKFSMCNLKPGDKIEYCDNPAVTVEVADDNHVIYNGQIMSLTAVAKMLRGNESHIAGPKYFKYKGEWLNTIRHRNGF